MKTIKLIMMAALVVIAASCKKEGKQGEQGLQGIAGPEAKTFTYDLTFDPGEIFESYSGISGFDAGDVVTTFMWVESVGGESFWSQTPIIIDDAVNIIPAFAESSGFLFVYTKNADGTTGSPWLAQTTYKFKSVLIKSTQLAENPNVDLTNYKEVEEAFGFEE